MRGHLYNSDVLSWSEQQAALLRRLACGEKVNTEIDWPNVIEEVRDVGQSELRAVRSLLARAIEHLLKAQGWPTGPVEHWRREVLAFLLDARRSWAPSMHGRIDLFQLYEDAWAATSASTLEGEPPNALPPRCPFGIEHLIVERPRIPDLDFLLAMLR